MSALLEEPNEPGALRSELPEPTGEHLATLRSILGHRQSDGEAP